MARTTAVTGPSTGQESPVTPPTGEEAPTNGSTSLLGQTDPDAPAVPAIKLPAGFQLLSKAAGQRERKNDPYKDLRAVIGQFLLIEAVDQEPPTDGSDTPGALILTVYPVLVNEQDGAESRVVRNGQTFKVPAPKAAVTMLKRAQERGVSDSLIVYVQETKRGIALR